MSEKTTEKKTEDRWLKEQINKYEKLQKKYEGNSFFEALEDVQLAISNVMEELERGNYEIVDKMKDK